MAHKSMYFFPELEKRSRMKLIVRKHLYAWVIGSWRVASIGSRVCVHRCKTVVRRVYGNSKCFEVKVVMDKGSAFSTLLHLNVMEAVSGELGVDLPWELLYADDLVVIWIKPSGERQKLMQKAASWSCGVCYRSVGSNSIQCTSCQKWYTRSVVV